MVKEQGCIDPFRKDYKYYGQRGIRVCSEWDNEITGFGISLKDMFLSYEDGLELFDILRSKIVNEQSLEGVENVFYYDETSPSCLRWKVNIYGGKKYLTLCKRAGSVAGHLNKTSNYYEVRFNNKTTKVHRIVMELNGICTSGFQVDHINGDRNDNKLSNLRIATHLENGRNQKKSHRNSSGVVGVSLCKTITSGKEYEFWLARVSEDGVRKCKSFSVSLYGNDLAKDLAISWREFTIREINTSLAVKGASGYTDRHGT